MALTRQRITVGTLTERPAATAVPSGTLYRTTDNGAEKTYRSNGSTWVDQNYGGGGSWPGFYESTPAALGTATPGTATTAAHGDHVHSSSHAHAATDVTQDSTHRFATDAEKSTWNGKEAGGAVAAHAGVTTSVHGFDSSGCAPPTIHGAMSHSEAYEVTGAKGAVNGYAGLGATQKVPTANLGGAGADNTKYLRGDQTWAVPTASGAPIGREPCTYPTVFTPNAAFTTALALAANGGSIAIPFQVNAPLRLVSVTVRNLDTATARAWRWDLYKDTVASSLTRVANPTAAEAFTPSAASTRTLAASTPTLLDPGTYWLVIQSTHATSSFGLGSTAAATFNGSSGQTKTTTNPNGVSLDFVAATWVKVTAMYAARLNGAVFGQSTAF